MEYARERWVQRLRTGTFPPIRGTVAGVAVLGVLGLVATVLVAPHLGEIWSSDRRGRFGVTVLPWLALASAAMLAVGTHTFRRRDRQAIAHARAWHVAPEFFLPVLAQHRGDLRRFGLGDEGTRQPLLWTLDTIGLHAWDRDRAEPVVEVPWAEVDGFEPEERRLWNGQSAWTLSIRARGGRLGLAPRPALGSPLGTSPLKSDVAMRVLRSLRGELDTGRTPKGSAVP